jgi:hypothetical protein
MCQLQGFWIKQCGGRSLSALFEALTGCTSNFAAEPASLFQYLQAVAWNACHTHATVQWSMAKRNISPCNGIHKSCYVVQSSFNDVLPLWSKGRGEKKKKVCNYTTLNYCGVVYITDEFEVPARPSLQCFEVLRLRWWEVKCLLWTARNMLRI